MLILKLYLLSWAISVVAFTYSEILTDHGMILYKWRGILFMLFKNEDHFIFKILVGCAYCVSGQWMLWIYLYLCIFGNELFGVLDYDLIMHIALISITVFNTAIIKHSRIYEREN